MPIIETSVETNVEVEFEVFCSCGEGLCNQSETRESRTRRTPQVVVEPCQKCLDRAEDAGQDKGYERGYAKGRQDYEE